MMEKKNIQRVRQLYLGLFIMVVAMVLLTLFRFLDGASAGVKMSVSAIQGNHSPVCMVADFDVKGADAFSAFNDMPSYSPDGQVWVYQPGVFSYNVLVAGTNPALVYTPKVLTSYALLFFALVCHIAVFVLLFMILNTIRASLRSATVFSRKIVRYMKLLGYAVIVGTIASDVAMYLMHLNAVDMVTLCAPDTGVKLDAGVPVHSVTELFIGVVIIFLAEVFDIGYRMSEEQKLTV